MRFVVYGAGAIGGAVGGRLALAGHPVTLIARGAHLRAIQSEGLRLVTMDEQVTIRLPAVPEPADVEWRPGDVVLLAVKSQDSGAALRALASCADPDLPVVCLQNGVANELAALRRFANVYGVCVMFPATHLEPGLVIGHSAPVAGLLDIGRYPGGADLTAEAIAAAFQGAAISSLVRTDIMRWKYTKLLTNLGNAIEALCGAGAQVDELVERARAEGRTVLAAAGIPYASAAEDAARRANHLSYAPGRAHPRGGGSAWQSLARGTGVIEADYLNGEIVLLGRVHRIPTPVNDLAQRLANQYAAQRRRPASLPAAEFAGMLAA